MASHMLEPLPRRRAWLGLSSLPTEVKLSGADHYPPFRANFTRDALLWMFAHRR